MFSWTCLQLENQLADSAQLSSPAFQEQSSTLAHLLLPSVLVNMTTMTTTATTTRRMRMMRMRMMMVMTLTMTMVMVMVTMVMMDDGWWIALRCRCEYWGPASMDCAIKRWLHDWASARVPRPWPILVSRATNITFLFANKWIFPVMENRKAYVTPIISRHNNQGGRSQRGSGDPQPRGSSCGIRVQDEPL